MARYNILLFTAIAICSMHYVTSFIPSVRSIALNLKHDFQSSTLIVEKNSALASSFGSSEPEGFPVFGPVVVTGVISKENDFVNTFVLGNLFSKSNLGALSIVVDNAKFARQRIISPKAVYSGLTDALTIKEVPDYQEKTSPALKDSLMGSEVWLAFNVSTVNKQVVDYASLAAEVDGLKRVVFGVKIPSSSDSADSTEVTQMIDEAVNILSAKGIEYTIVKFADIIQRGEAKAPYRIVRKELPLPTGNPPESGKNDGDQFSTPSQPLSSDDLFRVLSEAVDIPKTFNNVYGIGPGSRLDAEILIYMKSRGWPERVQVGILMGELMERIERQYEEAKKEQAIADANPNNKKALPKKSAPAKTTGFFT